MHATVSHMVLRIMRHLSAALLLVVVSGWPLWPALAQSATPDPLSSREVLRTCRDPIFIDCFRRPPPPKTRPGTGGAARAVLPGGAVCLWSPVGKAAAGVPGAAGGGNLPVLRSPNRRTLLLRKMNWTWKTIHPSPPRPRPSPCPRPLGRPGLLRHPVQSHLLVPSREGRRRLCCRRTILLPIWWPTKHS